MLFSKELYVFTDDLPVFQMSCRTEILSAPLGSNISTALPGCFKTPVVLLYSSGLKQFDIFSFYFFLWEVNMFLNSILEIAPQFHL